MAMNKNKLRSWWIMDDFELATQQKQIVAIKMRCLLLITNLQVKDQFATMWTMEEPSLDDRKFGQFDHWGK